jgi:hypothetical protein
MHIVHEHLPSDVPRFLLAYMRAFEFFPAPNGLVVGIASFYLSTHTAEPLFQVHFPSRPLRSFRDLHISGIHHHERGPDGHQVPGRSSNPEHGLGSIATIINPNAK